MRSITPTKQIRSIHKRKRKDFPRHSKLTNRERNSQGERMQALAKMSENCYNKIAIKDSDNIILLVVKVKTTTRFFYAKKDNRKIYLRT